MAYLNEKRHFGCLEMGDRETPIKCTIVLIGLWSIHAQAHLAKFKAMYEEELT